MDILLIILCNIYFRVYLIKWVPSIKCSINITSKYPYVLIHPFFQAILLSFLPSFLPPSFLSFIHPHICQLFAENLLGTDSDLGTRDTRCSMSRSHSARVEIHDHSAAWRALRQTSSRGGFSDSPGEYSGDLLSPPGTGETWKLCSEEYIGLGIETYFDLIQCNLSSRDAVR